MDESGELYEPAHVAEFYDHAYETRLDVGFYVDLAKQTGGPVLELGCGSGRVLIPTARERLDVTGIDLSEHMLDICRANLAQEPGEVRERISILHADIRATSWVNPRVER